MIPREQSYVRRKGSQLYCLRIGNEARVAVLPFQRHLHILVCVHEDFKGAYCESSGQNAQGSSRRGRNVMDAVIWRMMAWISRCISDSSFSLVLLFNRTTEATTRLHLTRSPPYRSPLQRTNVPALFDYSIRKSLARAYGDHSIPAKLAVRSDFMGYSELG